MAQLIKDTEIVTRGELLISQVIQLDALTQLLIEKGIISKEEFFDKVKQVRQEYESKRASCS